MGLLKGIEKLSDHKDVTLNEEMFQQIEIWKSLYKGYYEKWHNITYQTVEGRKQRIMESLNMAKASAAEMASLVFNEKCEISISDDTLANNIEEVFKQNKFYKKFQDYLEYSFALGGMVIKPYVEDEKIRLSFVTADCFIPLTWQNETIYEAVFPSEYKKGDKKYTHLEWHVWEDGEYVIRNELYESNGQDLGIKVALSTLFPDLEEEVRISGLSKPIFTYFKPNTANNIDTQSPLGISIYANALDTMKAIDTAFDSLHREFRLGKKRIIVPAHMVQVVIDPQTGEPKRYFNTSDETYEALNADENDVDIRDMTVELRVEEHIEAINALLNLFAMQTGFSAGTFTFDGESMKTATEVISEQSKTFKSKQSHEVIIEASLQELIDSIVAIAELYNIFSAPENYEVAISFDDSIAEDKSAEINQQIQLVTNQLQSRKRAIMRIHGMTEEDAEQLLQEIYAEERQGSPDFEELQSESVLFGARE
ncbi:phage portal protein [Novibacillus thermophilus]|uniref:Portal protein n=1 Tax=Novibacillus thermophilus TaxID=1471761 RepID=A0A1U9K5F8_9BACL|nr:portal protein [Novibacillus thermophilus]